jgi:hypothetical protein
MWLQITKVQEITLQNKKKQIQMNNMKLKDYEQREVKIYSNINKVIDQPALLKIISVSDFN